MSKKRKNSLVWDGMSKKKHSDISKYVGRMASTLGLLHWKIRLSHEFCEENGDDDVLATIQVLPGRHYATIRLAKDFNTYPYEDKKQAIIHELFHCHQQKLLLWADDTLREALGIVAYEVFMAAYRDNFEHMVDDLSVVFEKLIDDDSARHLLEGK